MIIGASDTITTSNGNVTFGSTVNDTTSNTDALTIAAGSGVVTFGSTVGSTKLASLTTTGPTTLDANVTTGGNQTYNRAVTIGADATLQSTSGSGVIDFASTVDGAHNLTVNAEALELIPLTRRSVPARCLHLSPSPAL